MKSPLVLYEEERGEVLRVSHKGMVLWTMSNLTDLVAQARFGKKAAVRMSKMVNSVNGYKVGSKLNDGSTFGASVVLNTT